MRMSLTVQLETGFVAVPDKIHRSLAAFRDWAGDNDLPEKTRIDFYKGKVWVDMGREQVFTHGLLKTQFAAVLTALVERDGLGYYWCNGVLVTNEDAYLSGNPTAHLSPTTRSKPSRLPSPRARMMDSRRSSE